MKKQGNELAIRREASLAATAWNRLQEQAQAVLNDGEPALQLFADAAGVVARISDAHGTHVVIEHGKISVSVAQANED